MKAFNPFDHVDKSKGSLDESVLLSVKKCWKKDTATRSKGLLELTDWVSTCPEPEELEIFRDEYVRIGLVLSVYNFNNL